MGRITLGEFMESATLKGGTFFKWKEKGKTIGWIHPGIGLYERDVHNSIPVEEDNDGKKEVNNRRYNCAGEGKCPLCALNLFANKAIADGASPGETILDGGRNKASYTLNELAAQATGRESWRTNFVVKHEFLIPWISADESERAENPVVVVTAADALGFAINKEINSVVEDRGEVKGNPMKNPYALKLVYNEKEVPMRKYEAHVVDSETAPITPDVKEIMSASQDDLGIDLDKMTEPGDVQKMLDGVESCWASRTVTFQEFLSFYEGKSESKSEGRGRGRGAARGKAKEEAPESTPPRESEPEAAKGKATGGTVYCAECGAKVAGKFCPECGAKVADAPKAESKPAGGKVKCQECNELVTPNKYGRCTNCNARVAVNDDDVPY